MIMVPWLVGLMSAVNALLHDDIHVFSQFKSVFLFCISFILFIVFHFLSADPILKPFCSVSYTPADVRVLIEDWLIPSRVGIAVNDK